MSRKLKKVVSVLLIIGLVVSLAACSSGGKEAGGDQIVIGATWQNLQNEYIKGLADHTKDYADEVGIKLLEADGQGKAENQLSQVENFIAQGVDAVILNPFDRDGCAPIVDRLNQEGIPVIVVCSEVTNLDKATSFVGSDDTEAGRIEMEFIAEQLGEKGNIVVMQGPTGHSAEINRTAGIHEVLKNYSDIQVLFQQPADFDRAKGMTLVENWLQSGKQIDAIVAENDEMALGAYKAIEAAGLAGKVKIIGVDAVQDALNSVKAGQLDATVLQDAKSQAVTSIDIAIKAIKGEDVEKKYMVPFQLITKDNVNSFLNN